MGRGHQARADNPKDQCEAITVMTEWKRRKGIDSRCPFFARLSIGGKRLCHKHAQIEALAILVGDEAAVLLPALERRLPYQKVSVVGTKAAR